MGFSLEQQNEVLQEKTVRGQYHKVAVGCWFTASGRSIPKIRSVYKELHADRETGC